MKQPWNSRLQFLLKARKGIPESSCTMTLLRSSKKFRTPENPSPCMRYEAALIRLRPGPRAAHQRRKELLPPERSVLKEYKVCRLPPWANVILTPSAGARTRKASTKLQPDRAR